MNAPNPSALSSAFFASCPRGLEAVLADELRNLQVSEVRIVASGASFSATPAQAMAVNLHSRIASRILMRLGHGHYHGDDDLYRLSTKTPWERWFDASKTMRIDVNAIRSPLRSLNFAMLRIKDGIVDRFRSLDGRRPSIDTQDPQVRVVLHLREREATLYLDLSGRSLFMRGWRQDADDKGAAPIKENLAAALVQLSGWQADQTLYDPFCGSGTVLIEAAQRALDMAPGLDRAFGFEQLDGFDAATWQTIRQNAQRRADGAKPRARALRIHASDIDTEATAQTARNARRAGLPEGCISVRRGDALRAQPPGPPGVMLSNPPYGERLAIESRRAEPWQAFGQHLKQAFGGWRVFLLTSDMDLPHAIGMKERRRVPLFNGPLECRLFGFDVRAPREVQAS